MNAEKSGVRRGTPADAEDFARLVLMAGHVLKALYRDNARTLMLGLYPRAANIYSYEHTYFAELDDRTSGMLLGFDHDVLGDLQASTRRKMQDILKLEYYLGALGMFTVHRAMGGLKPGEYLISNIAVYPEFRRRGVGRRLIEHASIEASDKGCVRLVLDVETSNETAVHFYETAGFSAVANRRRFTLGRAAFQFLKMARPIG